MKEITFIVSKWASSLLSYELGTFLLVPDNWDDLHYKTSFSLRQVRAEGVFDIGYVKIGHKGAQEGDPLTPLPVRFDALDNTYFSLGQDRDYYEKIMKLPDGSGKDVLRALRDVSISDEAFAEANEEPVFRVSLMRDLPMKTVRTQFKRIVNGGAQLTPYEFEYRQLNVTNDRTMPKFLSLDFNVEPESTPPTNVHVVIGPNGVGKSHFLKNLIAVANGDTRRGSLIDKSEFGGSKEWIYQPFANVVSVAFSAFDDTDISVGDVILSNVSIHRVGLQGSGTEDGLTGQFVSSFQKLIKKSRHERWLAAFQTLIASDSILRDTMLQDLMPEDVTRSVNIRELSERFTNMSSGHKIVLLTITRIIELVEEQSLVLLDEPETHLHPPLLSALMRAISDIVLDRNAVAIVATHSPVVLQEVPRSCVWVLRRNGDEAGVSRLDFETFGESVTRLTTGVFHLDAMKTGYYEVLRELMESNSGSRDAAMAELNGQVGTEGLFALYALETKESNDV